MNTRRAMNCNCQSGQWNAGECFIRVHDRDEYCKLVVCSTLYLSIVAHGFVLFGSPLNSFYFWTLHMLQIKHCWVARDYEHYLFMWFTQNYTHSCGNCIFIVVQNVLLLLLLMILRARFQFVRCYQRNDLLLTRCVCCRVPESHCKASQIVVTRAHGAALRMVNINTTWLNDICLIWFASFPLLVFYFLVFFSSHYLLTICHCPKHYTWFGLVFLLPGRWLAE